MIPVRYEHPPRDLGFYMRIIFAVAVIVAPIFILVPLWTADAAPLPTLLLLGFLIVTRLPGAVLPAFGWLTRLTDLELPKSSDVSAEERPLPESLIEVALKLELEGFERLGECAFITAGLSEPITCWLYRSSGGQIVANVLLNNDTPPKPYLVFTTFGESGIVATTWPRGHQVKLPNARFSGVRGSVEAAYRHHLAEVRILKSAMGRILKIESMEQYLLLDRKFVPQSKVNVRQLAIDDLAKAFFETLWAAPLLMFIITILFSGSFNVVLTDVRSIIVQLVLIMGLILSSAIQLRARGIAGPKAS
jgi:hypothetical protein